MTDQTPVPGPGPNSPLLTRPEMVVIVILSALLLIGVAILQVREWVRDRNAIKVDRTGRGDIQYLIDLNTATWEELALLPGIGEAKAKAIIAHRERIGGFTSPQQLREVKGIGKDAVEKLLPLVTVSMGNLNAETPGHKNP